jgi:hypothetical protein
MRGTLSSGPQGPSVQSPNTSLRDQRRGQFVLEWNKSYLDSRMVNESPLRTTSSRRYYWFADSTVSWKWPSHLPLPLKASRHGPDQLQPHVPPEPTFRVAYQMGPPRLPARSMTWSIQYSWTPRLQDGVHNRASC